MNEQVTNLSDFPAKVVESSSSNINNYIDWFEKIDLNTFVWQIIAVIIIFYFGKELKSLARGLIKKIPHLKSAGPLEFDLSVQTKEEVKENSDKLMEELKAYEILVDKDPNTVFLAIFIEIESVIKDICTEYYVGERDDDLAWLRASLRELLDGLVRNEVLDPKVIHIFNDISPLRNSIAHGGKPIKSLEKSRPYFEALLLLKETVSSGHEKVLIKKGNKQ